jgi:hypothetical protein
MRADRQTPFPPARSNHAGGGSDGYVCTELLETRRTRVKNTLLVTLSAALAITVASAVSPAHAQRAPGITIVMIRDYYGPDEYQQVSPIYQYPSPQTLAKAQEEIRSSPNIRALLQRRGISFRNVVGVQTALNGGKVIYVR